MKVKIVLLLATGFCVGVMMQEAISQLQWRQVAIGGEIFFVPMLCLLVWLGWMLRGEFKRAKVRRYRDETTRRK